MNFKCVFDFNDLLKKIDEYGYLRYKEGNSERGSDEWIDAMSDANMLYDEMQELLFEIDSEIVKKIKKEI